ncbi:DUF2804 domain-containing protein [Leifsonia sp. A12D58]|uniref:DUF2804 domain-containing protein n=1 Tax=Leifsonia sp. A12D58 TaxID=3397674 RepID=UPI0039DF746C
MNPNPSRREREITEPVDLCLPDGSLNPAAVGWTRRPLHRTNLRGWGRNKRFEYWAITTPDHILALNISQHDYRANVSVTVMDRVRFSEIRQGGNRWLPRRGGLQDPNGAATARGRRGSTVVELTANSRGTALRATSDRIQVDVQVLEPSDHQSMGVVVPWSRRKFQYTRKNNCLRVEGSLVIDGVEYALKPESTSATHDHGRGRWPYRTFWNWGSGSGTSLGHDIGLQFGGKWTDGTGSTENWLRLDGELHKISDELQWTYDPSHWLEPWRINGQSVNVTFTPIHHFRALFNRWIVMARADTCYGHFSGDITLPSGDVVLFDNIYGHVEDVARRW